MTDLIKIIFPVSMEAFALADDIFSVIARKVARDDRAAYNIRMVLSEAFSNAFLYCERHSSGTSIEFRGCFKKDVFAASIINEGAGFADNINNMNDFPSPMMESGRGIMIMQRLCGNLQFRKHGNNKFEVYMEISTGTKDNQELKSGGKDGHSKEN